MAGADIRSRNGILSLVASRPGAAEVLNMLAEMPIPVIMTINSLLWEPDRNRIACIAHRLYQCKMGSRVNLSYSW